MKLTKKLPFINRNKKRKSKKGGSSQMVTKDKKLEYKDYNSELDTDKILSTEKSFEVILDKKHKQDLIDIENVLKVNDALRTELLNLEMDMDSDSLKVTEPKYILSDIMCFYNVFSQTSFGIELELCIKILNEEFLKQIPSNEEDKTNTDIRSNLELLLNHKLKALMVPESKWNYFLSERNKESNRNRITEPSGEYTFVIDPTKQFSGKKWSLIDDTSIQCDFENNYFRNEIVSPVLMMGKTNKKNYPISSWTDITNNDNIDYDEGIEIIKNMLESVIKSDSDAISISNIGGSEIQEPVCSYDKSGDDYRPEEPLETNSCGLHVHVSNSYMLGNSRLGKYLFWNLCRNWYFFEPILNTLISPDRYLNFYSRNIPRSKINNQVFNHYNIDKMKWILDNMSLTQIANLYAPPSHRGRKYYKINFNFVRESCRKKSQLPLRVEFRGHQGSSDFSEIRNWIYICTKFFSNTITSSLLMLTKEEAELLGIPEKEITELLDEGFLKGESEYFCNNFLEGIDDIADPDFISSQMFDKLFNLLLLNPINHNKTMKIDTLTLRKYYFNKLLKHKTMLSNSRKAELRSFKKTLVNLIEDIKSNEQNKYWLGKDIVRPDLWGDTVNGIFIPNEEFISFKKI